MESGTTPQPTVADSVTTMANLNNLRGTTDRWMFSRDFDIRNAEAALEVLQQKHQKTLSRFGPHARRCQAECRRGLYSHAHEVVDKGRLGDKTLDLVRWKVCWAPESNIDDQDWVKASREVNKDPRRRQSTRLTNSAAEEMLKYKDIMMVVKLDEIGR